MLQLKQIYSYGVSFFNQTMKVGNGKFSITIFTNMTLQFIKLIGDNSAKIFIDNLSINKYATLTYDKFMEDIKQFLNDIGTIKHGSKSINKHVQGFILLLIDASKYLYQPITDGINVMKSKNEQFKESLNDMFDTLVNSVSQARQEGNKLMNFTLDVLVPGIDGLFLLERGDLPKNQHTDKCFKMSLYKDLSLYRESIECDLAMLKDDIRKMKKDKLFIENFLNRIKEFSLKYFDEVMKITNQNHAMVSYDSIYIFELLHFLFNIYMHMCTCTHVHGHG